MVRVCITPEMLILSIEYTSTTDMNFIGPNYGLEEIPVYL